MYNKNNCKKLKLPIIINKQKKNINAPTENIKVEKLALKNYAIFREHLVMCSHNQEQVKGSHVFR